ncbi:hypothetical protein [Streptomyces varsoviensis]|uniref:ATP-grasp domain-containing protein n=1 Tax=Streptomyces varsoviensis TaxID=67373 RepID=A0ABR5ISB0_9ACTN|nr:hypothetical protein [Streptomyces varsoviensis]KOG51970.1 hypothetical protein ADK38_44460 [Streptomyces varsoviensis]
MRQVHLMRAAQELGIEVHDRMAELGIDLVVYRHGTKSIPVLEGRYDDQLRARDFFLTEDKHATKQLLRRAGFTTPKGCAFAFDCGPEDTAEGMDEGIYGEEAEKLAEEAEEAEEAKGPENPEDPEDGKDGEDGESSYGRALAFAAGALAELDGDPVVVKPRAGMHGDAVRMGLDSAEAVAAHMNTWRHRFRDWIVEERVDGRDLRIQLIGGELVAACVREPASVIGDGQTPLAELIKKHDAEIRALNPSNRLTVDSETEALLHRQGLEPGDAPAAGRVVRLKNTANLAKGGRAVDVSDSLHPGFHAWASAISQLFATDILAIDAICAAPHRPPEGNAAILEINTAPEWVHHTFSEHRTHDIAARVLRHWFGL